MKYDISLFEQLNEEYRSKPTQTAFPQTAPDYQFKTARSRLARLNKLVPLKNKRILEVGCGRGYVSSLLASEYNCSVIGVDIKKRDEWDSLRKNSPNLDYRVVDLSHENPFDIESFDLIVSFVAWEHIIHPFTMLRECCKILKPWGAMYIYANLYRSPNASHRYGEVFFPFPHLIFNDEVFSQYYMKHTGKSKTASPLNKLTYSHYKEYFRILNLRIEHERLNKIPLDRDFYNRFKDKLEPYPIFDLELAFFTVLLRKDSPGVKQSSEYKSQLRAVKNSFSFRLGNMVVQAVRKPGRNTIFLPYRLTRICYEEFKKRKAMAAKGTVETKIVKEDIPGQEYSKQKNKATSDKYTELRLAGVTLNPHTSMIKKKYIERFGVDKSRLGGYLENDWRRIEYISSLLPEGKSVLDIGIGNGAFLNLLMSLNRFQRILGIDIRRHSKFSKLFGSQLYQIMYASVTNLPFANKCIDAVTCMEVLEHLDRQSFMAALRELRRVGRFLIITVPYNEPEPLPSYHKLRFTDSDLLTYFPQGEFILLKKSTGNAWVAIVERS